MRYIRNGPRNNPWQASDVNYLYRTHDNSLV